MKKRLMDIPLVILLCFTFGCPYKEAKTRAVEEQNKALIKRYIEGMNIRNADIIMEVYASNSFTYFPSGSTTPTSQEESIEMTKIYFNAFPDLTHSIEELITSGDKVIVRFTARGTHKGEFYGIPATGNMIELSGIAIFRIEDGKVVEERAEADMLGFMQQLGMELKPKEAEK
jgi:steroid delta-isomerase-like uncharacterized protein